MTNSIEINCIRKTDRSDPHERIHGVGGGSANGTKWYLPINDAISGVESGKWKFYTSQGGKPAWVVIGSHNGHKYLKTEADGIYPNNLLSLPECS